MTKKKNLKLRGKIIEKFGTYSEFAKSINMKKSTLSCKLNNRGLSNKDIAIFCDVLGISKQEIGDYFFS